MFVRRIAAIVMLMLVATVSHSQDRPVPMKGYQLFTWKQNGEWHYSLFLATNREPTYEDITAKATVVVGRSEFESQLKHLPAGTEVFWHSDAPSGIRKPTASAMISFKLPSRKRIERLRSVCEKFGIKLTLM